MSEHTPCDCSVDVQWDEPADTVTTEIEYCPLHTAAPDLLAALEGLCGAVTIYAANSQQEQDRKQVAVLVAWEQARKAIAKANNTQVTGQGIRPASSD